MNRQTIRRLYLEYFPFVVMIVSISLAMLLSIWISASHDEPTPAPGSRETFASKLIDCVFPGDVQQMSCYSTDQRLFGIIERYDGATSVTRHTTNSLSSLSIGLFHARKLESSYHIVIGEKIFIDINEADPNSSIIKADGRQIWPQVH